MSIDEKLYLTKEEFYRQNESVLGELIGRKNAQSAWGLQYMDPASDEFLHFCRKVQGALVEKFSSQGASAKWLMLVSEAHEVLSLDEWIEHVLQEASKRAKSFETGYPDIDLNLETQLACGLQMESFHAGDYGKSRIAKLFEPGSFRQQEVFESSLSRPLPVLLDELRQDLRFGVSGGVRHPYLFSVAVGCMALEITSELGEVVVVPVVRLSDRSNFGVSIELMHAELKERFKGLAATVKEQQEHLKALPEGWPNSTVYNDLMLNWTAKRFVGDNGLVGSDFFDGTWLKSLADDVGVGQPAIVDVADKLRAKRESASLAQSFSKPSPRI